MNREYSPPNPVAKAVWQACMTELEALKPGNVSLYAEGHGMGVDDFVLSARCIADVLGQPGMTVGERILQSVEATRSAVECNTNLGIVLLCAPLTHAVLEPGKGTGGTGLRRKLHTTLEQLTKTDTDLVFRAIRLARPAGLGQSPRHDVENPVAAPLLEVMAEAEHRDRIAYQYTHGFADVFDTGIPTLEAELTRWPDRAWAAVGVYLEFLARFPDSHIERKLGSKTAEDVRLSAAKHLSLFRASDRPEQVAEALLAFDRCLKQRGINPGTSADLTVATMLARDLQKLTGNDFTARTRRAAADTRESASARVGCASAGSTQQ